MVGERVIGDLLIRDDDVLRNSDDVCLLIDSDTSVEVATERVFVVGHKYVLEDLKELVKYFGLAWKFCTARSSKAINFNRDNYKSK